jgi:hypothetical protein
MQQRKRRSPFAIGGFELCGAERASDVALTERAAGASREYEVVRADEG